MNEIQGTVLNDETGSEDAQQLLSEASDILSALLKALKAYRLYLPTHPLLQDFVQNVHGRLQSLLSREEELCLKISQFRISVESEPVYENTVKEQSLAFRLFIHGIREVTFHGGILPEELAEFLQVLHRAFDSHSDADDLLANLWERDLPHVNFIVLDDLFDAQESAEFEEYLRERSEAPVGDAAKPGLPFIADSLPPVEPATFSAQDPEALTDLLTLNEEEEGLLQTRIDEAESRMGMTDIDELVLSLVPSCMGLPAQAELHPILSAAIETLLHAGSLASAARIHRVIKSLAGIDGAATGTGPHLDADRVLQAVRPHLAERPLKDPDVLAAFLSDLGAGVVGRVAECLADPSTREGAFEILCRIVPRTPGPLLALAKSSTGSMLKPLLRIIAESGDHRALDIARSHLKDREALTRREALLCIQKIGSADAYPIILGQLDAAEPEMRILAARALSEMPPGPHLAGLLDLASSRRFAGREFLEKREILLALGRQPSEKAEDFLITLTARGRWLRKKIDPDLRATAVTALAQRGSERARKAVESALGDKSPQVHLAAKQAVRALSPSPGAEPTSQE